MGPYFKSCDPVFKSNAPVVCAQNQGRRPFGAEVAPAPQGRYRQWSEVHIVKVLRLYLIPPTPFSETEKGETCIIGCPVGHEGRRRNRTAFAAVSFHRFSIK